MFAIVAGTFVALIGAGVIFERRRLAHAQALVLGGSILPGCAVVEGAVLVLIGLAIAVFGRNV